MFFLLSSIIAIRQKCLKLHHDPKEKRLESISVRGASREQNEMQKIPELNRKSVWKFFRIIFSSIFMFLIRVFSKESNKINTLTHTHTQITSHMNALHQKIFFPMLGFMINLQVYHYVDTSKDIPENILLTATVESKKRMKCFSRFLLIFICVSIKH